VTRFHALGKKLAAGSEIVFWGQDAAQQKPSDFAAPQTIETIGSTLA
jgi:hypothetical protein